MSDRALARLDRVIERAEALAGAWSARARICTTVGQERAMLRLLGVSGLDRDGRPLAQEVVDRYASGRPGRLAGGLVLPFAAALDEYDATPQELGLDVASGAVDLALEAEVLRDAGRRAAAEARARVLIGAALDRIDANRVARLELLEMIGDSRRPWLGVPLTEPTAVEGSREANDLVAGGADLIAVTVPAGRELADRLQEVGLEIPHWRPRPTSEPSDERTEPAPAGSQRGLSQLRQVIDGAAAERRAYARLATYGQPLGAPEQALVAAFERIDLVATDPIAEIVDGNIDPDRALADHAFARRLLARAGTSIVIGPGPLVVGPDLARGTPSDPATRAGRAFALQLLAVALARADGIPADRILVGALPPWLAEERDPAATAIAQVVLRRAALPGHPLVFEEPSPEDGGGPTTSRWVAILGAVLPLAGSAGLIVRSADRASIGRIAGRTRAAAEIATEVAAAYGPIDLRGAALDHARAAVGVALETLDRLAGDGWTSILADPIVGPGALRLGGDAVVERSESFDPLNEPRVSSSDAAARPAPEPGVEPR